jgi:hypothetical protein
MGDFSFEEQDQVKGISEEDQREILLEIEKVAGENRIDVSGDLFQFTALRKGWLFPALVNVIGLVLLVGGITALTWFFRAGEEELLEAGRVVVTAESRLIEEIRRETEQQLATKDDEINDIQAQLQRISAERAALAGDLEQRVAQREMALREELEQELEEERRRLRALNLSEEEVEARMASFAEVKEREFSQRMDQFRRQAEAEQDRIAQELNRREAEFGRSLTQANREREQLVRESAQRLSEVQREYEAQLAAGQAQLDAAQSELARLAAQQERELLLRGQIRGLYQTATGALRQGNHELARTRLQDLRSLLNDESVLRIPALREQRPVELILIDSLERLITLDEQFGDPDTARRLSEAQQVVRVQGLVDQAAEATAEGEIGRAVSLYQQALDVIPAVSESYQFITDVGAEESVQELARLNEEAAVLMSNANTALAAGQYQRATEQYSRVLSDYFRTRYRNEAIEGMQRTLVALQQSSAERLSELETDRIVLTGELETTREELTSARAEAESLTREIQSTRLQLAAVEQTSTLPADAQELREDLDDAERRLALAQERVTQLEETVDRREAALLDAEADLLRALNDLALAQARSGTSLDPTLVAEMDRLRALEEEVIAAQQHWERYRRETESLLAAGSDMVQILDARVALERFLSNATVRRLFPEMSGEIERYDQAYIASGRENALLDAADLLVEVSLSDTAAERIRLVRQARSGAAPAYLDFLEELEGLLASAQ